MSSVSLCLSASDCSFWFCYFFLYNWKKKVWLFLCARLCLRVALVHSLSVHVVSPVVCLEVWREGAGSGSVISAALPGWIPTRGPSRAAGELSGCCASLLFQPGQFWRVPLFGIGIRCVSAYVTGCLWLWQWHSWMFSLKFTADWHRTQHGCKWLSSSNS